MSQFEHSSVSFSRAVDDFHEARRKAALESILGVLRLRGKPKQLLAYDEVRQKLRAIESSRRDLEEIPMDKIVGSVNRYSDFTRSFLPKQASDQQRWARVKVGMEAMSGLPPIEAYKIGDVYFVSDGHHRVSVAAEMGAESIEGYVTPVYTHVPLSPGDSPDDIILKSEYADFLAKTKLDELRPEAYLLVTAPGQYPKLLEHIAVHRYFMGEKRSAEVPYSEAVTDWYDNVYQPIAALIRDRNLLRDFPGRTETDLYLWIMDHRAALSGGDLGWEVSPEVAARDFAARYSPTARRRVPRVAHRLLDHIIPEAFESGPPPGAWREEHSSPHRGDRLFDDILVTVPGDGKHWPAVELAIDVARREDARLTGLHVVSKDEEKESPETQAIQAEFARRCHEAAITERMLVETGQAANLLCQRSPWVDLIIFRLNYPPPTQPLRRLHSGTRLLIRRCSSPLLAVPDSHFHLNSALLAYGPGRKADEALFVATYLAGQWKIPLTVLVVGRPSGGKSGKTEGTAAEAYLERARHYLERHEVQANYIIDTSEAAKDPARAILLNAEAQSVDFLIMGGYESGPLREAVFGSTVDHVLRSTRRPILICR